MEGKTEHLFAEICPANDEFVVTTKGAEVSEAVVVHGVVGEGPNLTTFNMRRLRQDRKNRRKQGTPGVGGSETERKRAPQTGTEIEPINEWRTQRW